MLFIMQKWALAYKGTSTFRRYVNGLSEPDRFVFEKYFVELLPESEIIGKDYYSDGLRRKVYLNRVTFIYKNWLEFLADEIAAGHYIAVEGDK